MKPYLRPEFNIQSDDKEMVEKAREIVGDQKDPAAAAKKLMEWVYNNVEKKPVINVPSAVEVLKTKVGDCNEHAVLLTALLRASKIPARECVGLVYANGRFFYHVRDSPGATLLGIPEYPGDRGRVSYVLSGGQDIRRQDAGCRGSSVLVRQTVCLHAETPSRSHD